MFCGSYSNGISGMIGSTRRGHLGGKEKNPTAPKIAWFRPKRAWRAYDLLQPFGLQHFLFSRRSELPHPSLALCFLPFFPPFLLQPVLFFPAFPPTTLGGPGGATAWFGSAFSVDTHKCNLVLRRFIGGSLPVNIKWRLFFIDPWSQ